MWLGMLLLVQYLDGHTYKGIALAWSRCGITQLAPFLKGQSHVLP